LPVAMSRKSGLSASSSAARRPADIALNVHRNNNLSSPELACRELASEGGVWSGVRRMSSGNSKERREVNNRHQPLPADCSDCAGRRPSNERAILAERAALAERASAERAQSTCRACLAAGRAANFAEQVAAAERRVAAAEHRALLAEEALELERASGSSSDKVEQESLQLELQQVRFENEQLRLSLASSTEENQDLRHECDDAARRLEERAAELEGARAAAETADALAQAQAREIADLRAELEREQARFDADFREKVEAVQAECQEQLQASLNSRQRELEQRVEKEVKAGTEKEVKRLREAMQEQKKILSELESELRQDKHISNACKQPGDYMKMVKQKEGDAFSHDNAQYVLRFKQLEYHLEAFSKHLPPAALAEARRDFEAMCAKDDALRASAPGAEEPRPSS